MFSSYKKKIALQVRLAGTWNPLLQCCKACTCTYLSLSYKIQRNCRGQINSVHAVEANSGAKDTKTFLKIRVQNMGTANVPPAYNTT